jgi:hypothetical protein
MLILGPILIFSGCVQPDGDTLLETTASSLHLKGTPDIVDTVSVQVTGDNMEPIEEEVASEEDSLTLDVPSGNDRTFSVSVENETSTFSDNETIDLPSGELVTLPLEVDLSDINLIIPDRGGFGSADDRLIQVENIEGDGWTEIEGDSLPLDTNEALSFNDIDYDQFGRIYTTIHNSSTNKSSIIRFNTIGNFDSGFKVTAPTGEILGLAVDRTSDTIYFSYDGGYSIAKTDYEGADLYEYSDHSFGTPILGMAVDASGFLHLVTPTGGDGDTVIRFDPAGSGSIKSGNYQIYAPFDVTFKNGSLYVAGEEIDDTPTIYKLDADYGVSTTPEKLQSNPADPGETFDGPQQFLPAVGSSIFVIDDDQTLGARIIKIDGIPGSNWEDFKAADIGKDTFNYIIPS